MTKTQPNIIKDPEQYNTTLNFFIKYSITLLNKKHILRKKPLLEIKHILITKGYLQFKYHYRLLNSYLQQDHNLDSINITNLLYSLESYKKQPQPSHTLEEFFT